MLRFSHPEYFYLLLVIPATLILFLLARRNQKKRISQFGETLLMKRLMPDYSPLRYNLKFILWSLAVITLSVGLASPQLGSKLNKVKARGVDIMIALDVSNSMLSQDVKPNRLDNAKLAISKLIDNLRSDRIGMVIFAGKGYVQLPITTDYAAAKMFLSNINPSLVPTQGTAIGQAIEMAAGAFNEDARSRAIIIITDGENHEGDAIESAKQIAEKGIKIYTIGIGSPGGAPIPEISANGVQTGYKKDNSGNTVITRLNEGMLQQIAAAGKGSYIYASNTNSALKKVKDEISDMAQNDYETRLFSDYVERFQYFIAAALIFLLAELILAQRRSKWADRIKLFDEKSLKTVSKKTAVLVILMLCSSISIFAQSENRSTRKGNKLYNNDKYNEAELEYRRALEANNRSYKAGFNLGNALYKQKNFEEAASTWESLAERTDIDPNISSSAWYNSGNAMLQGKKYSDAIEAYKNALKINPKNEEARYNLAYAQKMLKNEQQNKNQQKQDQNKDQNKDQQKQDQNKDQQNQDQNKDQQKQDQNKDQQKQDQNKDQQNQQPQQQELQKRDAERMLEAMKNAEKKTLENLQKKQVSSQTQKIEKDW